VGRKPPLNATHKPFAHPRLGPFFWEREALELVKSPTPETQRGSPLRLERSSDQMNREAICDELRRLEIEVVEAEQALAEHEALLLALRRERQDDSRVVSELNLMREQQQGRQQDRLRLLALLQR
jgi:hypothetical protein